MGELLQPPDGPGLVLAPSLQMKLALLRLLPFKH